MSYTTIIKQDGTVTQDTTTSFTDGRIWKLATGECLRISDDLKIFKMSADGGKLEESTQLDTGAINKITLAVNRTETKACVIHTDGYGAYGTKLNILTIGDMSLSEDVDLTTGGAITPLRAIIDKTGEKIIWLGDNNTLYKMDLDGGNLESILIGDSCNTFCIDTNNNIYAIGDYYIDVVDFSTFTKTTINISSSVNLTSVDCFYLQGFVYVLALTGTVPAVNDGSLLLKLDTSDNTYIKKDIKTDYGINQNVCQFNASGFDNFGTFFGKKDGFMRRWQVNLDNLECTPARWETYPTKQVFSNDTNLSLVDYSGVNGNNADSGNLLTSSKGCTGAI